MGANLLSTDHTVSFFPQTPNNREWQTDSTKSDMLRTCCRAREIQTPSRVLGSARYSYSCTTNAIVAYEDLMSRTRHEQ